MSRTHKNSLLSVSGRKAMVEPVSIDSLTKVETAKSFNVTLQTVKKWVVYGIGHTTEKRRGFANEYKSKRIAT